MRAKVSGIGSEFCDVSIGVVHSVNQRPFERQTTMRGIEILLTCFSEYSKWIALVNRDQLIPILVIC